MKKNKKKEGDRHALDAYRQQIDTLDEQIVKLLSKRQEIAAIVGEIKRNQGMEPFDAAREQEVMLKLAPLCEGHLSTEAIQSIYREIFSAARSVQGDVFVAFLGPETTFTHQAAISIFGEAAKFQSAGTVEEIFRLVDRDSCHYGVVAIENAFEGSLNNTLDLFRESELKICAENLQRIRLHLLTQSDQMEKIKCLYSHPMAVAQCRAWIANHMPKIPLREVESTALAGEIAAGDPEAAAIGSQLTALTYGLKMLEQDIEDHPHNVTRFVAIGKTRVRPTGKDKTSLIFSVRHRPGALHDALKSLAQKRINMTRIESRPMRVRSWEYLFFADLEGHREDVDVDKAIKKMKECCEFFKWLGSYPVASSPWP